MYVCQVLVSGESQLVDVDPSVTNTRLMKEIMTSLHDAMATQQQRYDQELISLRNAMETQQRHYDIEMASLKQELIQHEAELTALNYELKIKQANDNKGWC